MIDVVDNHPVPLNPVPFEGGVDLIYDATNNPNTLPFMKGSLGALIVSAADIGVEFSNDSSNMLPKINRISAEHGRSFEIPGVVIGDGLGNKFSDLSLKGAGPYKLEKHKAPQADELDWLPWGFASNAALDRMIKTSEAMRMQGIDTEWPIAVGAPERFPVTLPTESGGTIQYMTTKEIYEAVDPEAVLPEGRKLAVFLRASRTATRVSDLSPEGKQLDNDSTGYKRVYEIEEINMIIDRFKNLAAQLATTQEDGREIVFDPDSPESRYDFIVNQLPKQIGRSLAKLHEIGLVHNGLTTGNIMASGGLVDLDSVTGSTLGLGDKDSLPIDGLCDLVFITGSEIPGNYKKGFHEKLRSSPFQLSGSKLVLRLIESGIIKPPTDIYDPASEISNVQLYKIQKHFSDNILQSYKNTVIKGSGSFAEDVLILYERARDEYMHEINNAEPVV